MKKTRMAARRDGVTASHVVIVQPELKQYRVRFYECLAQDLGYLNIDFGLFVGRPGKEEEAKKDNALLESDRFHEVNAIMIGPFRYIRVPVRSIVGRAVILEQATQNLNWYMYTLMQMCGLCNVGVWGHGRNRQRPTALGESVKRWLTRKANWCFAYTTAAKEDMVRYGVERRRITNVMNASDTRSIRQWLPRINGEAQREARRRLQIPDNARVAVYCGGLYRWKRIPMLLEACRRVRTRGHELHLVVIGDGPDAKELAGRDSHWLHHVGAQFGQNKVLYMSLGSAFLCPGLLGLAVLDAFAVGLPVLTMDNGFHSPEIEYLENGRNGAISADELDAYVRLIGRIMEDETYMEELRKGAWETGEQRSVEDMAFRFASGIARWRGA